MLDKRLIKLNSYTADTDELDPSKRTLITLEADCYAVERRDNQDGDHSIIYKFKACGSTIIKQGESKPILAKSKRSPSQRLRMAFMKIEPDEEFYQCYMDKLIVNLEDVILFLKER